MYSIFNKSSVFTNVIVSGGLAILFFLFLNPSEAEAATSTVRIYPTDDGFNQLYDNENQTSWSSARAYTGTLFKAPVTTLDTMSIRSDNQAGGKYRIYRGSMVFDTSIIPDNATIHTASLNLYKTSCCNAGSIDTVIMSHQRASTTVLAKNDWQLSNYGTTSFAREALLSSQYTSFNLNSSGLSYIDPNDYSIFGVMTEYDFDNVTPPASQIQSATFETIEKTGTSSDPYLEITYTVNPTTVEIYAFDGGINQLYDTEGQTVWSSARAYTGSLAQDPTNAIDTDKIAVRSDKLSGYYRLYRGSFVFDTSIIPDAASIESASLNFYKTTTNNAGDTEIVVTSHQRASTTVLAKNDWQLSNYGTTLFAREELVDSQYTDYSLNQSGLDYIEDDNFTVFGLMTEYDFDDVDPGIPNKAAGFYSSVAAGTSTDPYLAVTYIYPEN